MLRPRLSQRTPSRLPRCAGPPLRSGTCTLPVCRAPSRSLTGAAAAELGLDGRTHGTLGQAPRRRYEVLARSVAAEPIHDATRRSFLQHVGRQGRVLRQAREARAARRPTLPPAAYRGPRTDCRSSPRRSPAAPAPGPTRSRPGDPGRAGRGSRGPRRAGRGGGCAGSHRRSPRECARGSSTPAIARRCFARRIPR